MEEKGNDLAPWLLTPSLPNRFLAVVPRGRGEEAAKMAEKALRRELAAIAETVWSWLRNHGASVDWKPRFDAQIAAFPEITWVAQPWLPRERILNEAATWNLAGLAAVKQMLSFAENTMKSTDRDERYYDDAKQRLFSDGIFWSLHVELAEAKLAARRNTRDFTAWAGASAAKDSLTGKEEMVGTPEFYASLQSNSDTARFFQGGHVYGAPLLVKRLWCAPELGIAYLPDQIEVKEGLVAAALRGKPAEAIADEAGDPYIAVIALDGDDMGKWLSGEKLGLLRDHLAPKARQWLEESGGDKLPRLLTPSYHLQFSEALPSFAVHVARQARRNPRLCRRR